MGTAWTFLPVLVLLPIVLLSYPKIYFLNFLPTVSLKKINLN